MKLIADSIILTWLCVVSAPALSAPPTTDNVADTITQLSVEPPVIHLRDADQRSRFLVHAKLKSGRVVDVTHRVQIESPTSGVFRISAERILKPIGNGTGTLTVTLGSHRSQATVEVHNMDRQRRYDFENDVIPILSRHACNSSGCHGKAEGQNGIKLSVFGFNPPADFDALTKEGRGRRVLLVQPDASLLLTKAAGGVPHGGGVRIHRGSQEFNILRGWIASGAPWGEPEAPRVVSLQLAPSERVLLSGESQQLRVVATYSDGRTQDVSSMAHYQSNNEGLATVDATGRIRMGNTPGHVAVMASYMGAVSVFQALSPRATPLPSWPQQIEVNYIDGLVHARLRKLEILPSGPCTDAEFMRRVYLDIIGTHPTASEARVFLEDTRPDKRGRLVNDLLQRTEYADYQALKWSDLLRVDRQALGHKSAYKYHAWIRNCFASNMPFDEFARQIVAAHGYVDDQPGGHFYAVVGKPGEMASTLSQVFLGVRIACAECHHHPFDRWSQTSYYGMSAYFQQVKRKSNSRGTLLQALGNPVTKHPRTGQVVHAHPLGADVPAKSPEGDRRQHLAQWMTAANNPWFARNVVNRVWARFLGRGLVEPVDDFRDTNPATNPELLDALARDFVEHNYDLHHLIRTITSSATYQRTSLPNTTNESDEQNYSRALLKRMDAEVMMDAICQVTGIDEKFRNVPRGVRAVQLWDSQAEHYFLSLFGRPTRKTACECERNTETNVSQIMHILNSPEIHAKLSHAGGRVALLVDQHSENRRLAEELYLTFFARFPTTDERKVAVQYLSRPGIQRREAAEDLAWSLMNSLEFLFNH